MKTIQYYTKHVYGKELMYIADPDQANEWHNLTGSKTISPYLMTRLTNLTGVKFERVFEPARV